MLQEETLTNLQLINFLVDFCQVAKTNVKDIKIRLGVKFSEQAFEDDYSSPLHLDLPDRSKPLKG
jgi:hypothetical protein